MTPEELLNYVRRTNPEMTMEKLAEELEKTEYSSNSMVIASEMNKKGSE